MTTNILTTIINEKPQAFAYIMGETVCGTICFYAYKKGIIMIYEIEGLPQNQNGFYGFHIHEGKTCINDTSIAYEKTKGHLNPTSQQHPNHLGDLPPLFATKGKAWGMVYIDKLKINDIVDRTIVIHENDDDFHSQPAGNSGNKIACGEIKRFI